jgi:hypothetical protein
MLFFLDFQKSIHKNGTDLGGPFFALVVTMWLDFKTRS